MDKDKVWGGGGGIINQLHNSYQQYKENQVNKANSCNI